MERSKSPSVFQRLRQAFPTHGWLGLGLIALFWPLNWGLAARGVAVTSVGFFPLWLGYCLTVDAVNCYRYGTSLLTRSPVKYLGLFLISAPAWWLFELLNWRLQNWHYLGRELFSDLEYALLASLAFSTVVPAVFGTAEFFAHTDFVRNLGRWWAIRPNRPTTVSVALLGLSMFLAMMYWPRYFFPFLWLSLYFMLAPVNVWLGHRSLAERLRLGDWRPVISLWLGVLVCAFFWEMWNVFSFPKWVYTVPYLDVAHLFEMPLAGYLGYLPFSLELFALYHLVAGLLGSKRTQYVTAGLFGD